MTTHPTPRTTFPKWTVVACSIYTFGSAMGISASLSVMFLDWQDDFRVTRAQTAAVHSTCFSIVLGGAVFAGYLMNRIGARLTILTGSFLATAGMFASAFATSINFLIVSVGIVSGTGFCCVQLPVIPCATSVTRKYKTVVISLCQLASGVVGIVSRYLFRYLTEEYSWRGACMIIAGLVLQTSVGGLIVTSYLKTSNNSILDHKDDDKNAKLISNDPDIEVKVIDRHVSLMIINGSTSSLKPSMNGNELQDDVYQIKDCDTYRKNLSIPTNDLSKSGSQIIVIENNTILTKGDGDSDSNRSGHGNSKCANSKWRFFWDMMFVLLSIHIGICVASASSFTLILMDFSRTRKFDESTGLTFLTVTFAASLVSRVGVGVFGDLLGSVHSFVIQTLIAIPGGVALILLSFVTDRDIVFFLLALNGVSLGGMITIYPKCALDVTSVDVSSYPIAFGFFCTMEGMMTWIFSIAIGLAVDVTGSYTFILMVMGCLSLSSTFMLGCGYFYSRRQLSPSHNHHIKQRQGENGDDDHNDDDDGGGDEDDCVGGDDKAD